MVEWTTEKDELPHYHIEGSKNLADLLKKTVLTTTELSTGSPWQAGADLMKLDKTKFQLQLMNP